MGKANERGQENLTDRFIDEHAQALIKALQESLGFKSVSGEGLPDAPFGKGCRDALDHALGLCREFGFDTLDLDGYIGCADCGEGSETLGILAHLDVVPAGDDWTHDPFGGEIVDGRIVGRGALDDKGPAMAMIFALAAVKAEGRPFKRKVRLLFGCDEECGMRCLQYYRKSNQPMPDLAFSPDAEYPLVNCEKSIYHAKFRKAFDSCLCLTAGTVVNAVPGKAVALLPLPMETVASLSADYEAKFGFPCACRATEAGTELSVHGVAAHASMPENGKNALQAMLRLLRELPLSAADAAVAAQLCGSFGMEYYGESLRLDKLDDAGRLTLNLGLMHWDAQGFTLDIDIRAPISMRQEEIREKLSAPMLRMGAELVEESFSQGYLVPESSELVGTLLSVYQARTGDMRPPKHIGGGTYARCLPKAVAFGPERENRENLIHMANEAIYIEDLIDDAKMLAAAIAKLALC